MSSFINKLFGIDKRYLKKIEKRADFILTYEETMARLTDDELKAYTPSLKKQIFDAVDNGKPWKDAVDAVLPVAYAVAREAARRSLGQFPYKVQIMGAIVLNDGDVAEMKTGEGKTLTATMCVYLNALTGRGVHVVTVNEYLAARDAEWMGGIYRFLGLSVGCNIRTLSRSEKQEAFNCDITYTTNSEVGFDYLRDNMVQRISDKVLRPLYMAIIDEADSILIDESRTPLIISGGRKTAANYYIAADRFVKRLVPADYEIDLKSKTCHLSDLGNKKAESAFGIKNVYDIAFADIVHVIRNALKANYAMARDVDYMIKEGAILIIDPFTGRAMVGRSWSEGLHQAVEAKEGVKVNPETVTQATITYQNFFRLYEKIGGMTGTAKTEEEEFQDTYNMRVICIPTNRPTVRIDAVDRIFHTKEDKFKALLEEVKERNALGQPILIGTIAVETNQFISEMFARNGIRHEVLNAKNHEREAHIIEQAGQKGSITIATNMAGRGTDIKLGEGVVELGGLAVLGTERHEARRIDNQLRGRAGRQGDPGFSRFYVSFEDDLMLRFGGVEGTLGKFVGKNIGGEAIEMKAFSTMITNAQKMVEGYNFDSRKNVLEYDDVLRKQRESIYSARDKIIAQDDVHQITLDLFKRVAKDLVLQSCIDVDKEPQVVPEELTKRLVPSIFAEGELDINALKFMQIDKVYEIISNKILEKEEQKFAGWERTQFLPFEKRIVLACFDQHWQIHIDKMDKLRNGIRLRAYAQTNPLQDYIKEGFQLFEEMLSNIALNAARSLLHISEEVIQKVKEIEEAEKAENTNPEVKEGG
ncbi:MAG: preprotein translocase subunit SecA [Bacillales bacterium]|jgi:preprotein translocase subunit SecA|nr:preprotein translocase subunit SecA [Bacillales bacterium]